MTHPSDATHDPGARPRRTGRACGRRTGSAPSPAAAVLAALLAAAVLAGAPSTLQAHGEGTLELASASVAAGEEVAVRGSGFETGSSYRLVLVGALDEREIGEVRPDSAGEFSRSLRVPSDVEDGRYQLTAVAPDGDVVARVELAVVAGSDGGGGADTDDADGREARAGDMTLDRGRSGTEWAVIALLVGLAGGAGVRLLRG